jgi:hypothetical protein
MLRWIKGSDLKKEQVVSISTQESQTENGEAMLIVFYQSHQEISMSSLENLRYHLIKNVADWED